MNFLFKKDIFNISKTEMPSETFLPLCLEISESIRNFAK